MKRLLLVALFACSFFVPPAPAEAEPFLSIYSGASIPHSIDATMSTVPPAAPASMDFNFEMTPGFLVGGNAGMWLDNFNLPFVGLSLDFNASFPDLDEVSENGMEEGIAGDVSVFQTTVNLLFRVPTGPIRPYVGVGGGVYTMDMDDGTTDAGETFTSDSDTVGGWQVLAGVDVPLDMISKNLSAFAEYRYTAAKFEVKQTWVDGLTTADFETELDYNASQVFGGITWHFN